MARFRLRAVLMVAQDREEKARQALEKVTYEKQQAEVQLQQLYAYQEDYQKKQRSGIFLTPFQWQGYQDFILRIEQAIAIQKNICEELEKKVAAANKTYREKQRFLKGMEMLEQKHNVAEMLRQEKADQKLMDEFSVRKRRRDR